MVVLLSLSASHGGLSVLKSLSSFLVLDWVFQERVGTVLVDDSVLQVLLLLIGKTTEVNRLVHAILRRVIDVDANVPAALVSVLELNITLHVVCFLIQWLVVAELAGKTGGGSSLAFAVFTVIH